MTAISNLQTIFGKPGQAGGAERADATQASSGSGASAVAVAEIGTESMVSVSQSANALAGMGEDDVRSDKVAALQQAIAAGTYSVSSSDVADKLMNSMFEGS